MNLLPRLNRKGPQTNAIYVQAVRLKHYKKNLYQDLRETGLEVTSQYIGSDSEYLTHITEPTHLQAKSFHLSRTKRLFKRQRRPTSQNIDPGGAQQQISRTDKRSHCGLSNHAEENYRFLTEARSLCNPIDHQHTVCPSKQSKQHGQSTKKR